MKYCAKCGAKISENNKFCEKCGNKVNMDFADKSIKSRKPVVVMVVVAIIVVATIIVAACLQLTGNKKSNSDKETTANTNEGIEISDESMDGTEDIFADTETSKETYTDVQGETSEIQVSEIKLNREQIRSKNKASLLEIINNTGIGEEQKQDAINAMIAMTDIAEREAAAEMLLEAKGFTDVVVSITDDKAEVVLNMGEATDAKRMQVEDIVKRKTNIAEENIIITPIQNQAKEGQTGKESAQANGQNEDVKNPGENGQNEDVKNPGEAVLIASNNEDSTDLASKVKANREQIRSQNKESLLEIINNSGIGEEQKQDAINAMIAMTNIAEREAAAEMLLEAKGFTDVVVSITDDNADVVLNMGEVTDAKRAQVEDIVKRKTNVAAENIVITPIQNTEEEGDSTEENEAEMAAEGAVLD